MTYVVDDAIEEYAFQHTRAEPDYLTGLAKFTQENMDMPQMLTGRLEGRFLKMLVQLVRPKLAIEVGTFTGYSALSMAEAMDDDSLLITCEVDRKAQKVALEAFQKSPHGHKIQLRFGPAIETIESLEEEIDFAFVDADKQNYPVYYDAIVQRMRSGALMVIDNCLWSGEVLDPKDDDALAIAQVNEMIVNDQRVENVLLTVRDGVQLVRKN